MALNPTISSSFVAVMDLMSSTASDVHYVNDSATTASNYTTSERLLPEALLDGLRELGFVPRPRPYLTHAYLRHAP